MNAWRAKTKGALPITHHGRVEVINGICLAAHRREITADALTDTLASFDEDFTLTHRRDRCADREPGGEAVIHKNRDAVGDVHRRPIVIGEFSRSHDFTSVRDLFRGRPLRSAARSHLPGRFSSWCR
jgi:hypothetical protein